MSLLPSGPGARPKRSCSASQENDGRDSPRAVFTFGPRLTGADHASSTLARVAAQMSALPPMLPARLDEKTISRPSLRTFGWMSFAFGSFSSTIGAAGPNVMSPLLALTYSSPEVLGGRVEREK